MGWERRKKLGGADIELHDAGREWKTIGMMLTTTPFYLKKRSQEIRHARSVTWTSGDQIHGIWMKYSIKTEHLIQMKQRREFRKSRGE